MMKKASETDRKEINISNDIFELGKINHELEKLAENWSLSTKDVFEINLALEELITNIIFYAYTDELEHRILLNFVKSGNKLTITLIDNGKAFDPIEAEVPVDINKPLEERKIGGLGIHLVKKLMDDVSYCRKDNKNILTLKKKL